MRGPIIPLLLCALLLAALPASAASFGPVETEAATARIVTAQDGVPRDAATLSAALHVELEEGWKTYWRSPGEVGLPPAIDWSGSANVADLRLLYPAPERFQAFGIENFGYEREVAYPLEIVLEEPGAPVALDARIQILVCSTVCIPEFFRITGTLGPVEGRGIDAAAAALIADWAARVPDDGTASGLALDRVALTDDALVVAATSATPFGAPDLFPEIAGAAFGAPDLRLGDGGRTLWASLPMLTPPDGNAVPSITLVDGARAATLPVAFAEAPPAPPAGSAPLDAPERASLLPILLLALAGGLILNAMPCVLPVLSIKLAGAIALGGEDRGRVRAGFLASAAGVMAFVLALAGITLALRGAGVAVGWGTQFQSPTFLSAVAAVMAAFAANMLGLFEIALPSGVQTRLAGMGRTPGLASDFGAGALAALLATPCSAPFLGTAVAFALAGTAAEAWVVFAALGLGLAAPYLLVAAFPRVVRFLPRPGPWMAWLRGVLGMGLLLTALWLLWVLAGVAGPVAATGVAVALALLVAALSLPRSPRVPAGLGAAGATLALAAALALPALVAEDAAATPGSPVAGTVAWEPFERTAISRAVAEGRTVFVDVTADWCLTCKANKAAVLDREPVASRLGAPGVLPLRADWTRPDDAIRRYLRANERFGIPFNAVYGPGAPGGIVLPELLTAGAVTDALDRAGGTPVAALHPGSAQ